MLKSICSSELNSLSLSYGRVQLVVLYCVEFLSSEEYKRHQQTHLQTHLDKWSNKEEPKSYQPPQGLNPSLYKVYFAYYRIHLCYIDGIMIEYYTEMNRLA